MRRTKIWQAAIPTSLLAVSACGHISPYVAPDMPIQTVPGATPGQGGTTPLDNSLNYAIAQASAWRAKANAVSNTQLSLFAVALPTSAVAAYYGITGDRGSSAITALAGTSAGAFGLSMLSQSRPRQSIYLAGTNAMACVIWSAAPFAMPQSVYTQISTNTQRLSKRTKSVVDAAGDLDAEISKQAASGLDWSPEQQAYMKALVTQVDAAREHVKGTDEVITAAHGLLAAIDMAATQVYAHTMQIESMVNLQLSEREPSPEAVLQVAKEFSGSITSLQLSLAPPPETPVVSPASPPDTRDTGGEGVTSSSARENADKIAAAMAALQQKQRQLDSALSGYDAARATLEGQVNAHAQAMKAAAEIKACKAEGIAPMSITPADLAPAVSKDSTYEVTINGGSGIFNTRLVGATGNDVSISYANTPYPSRSPVIKFGPDASGSQSVAFADTNNTSAAPIIVTFSIGDSQEQRQKASTMPPGSRVLHFKPPPEEFPPTDAACEGAISRSRTIVFQAAFAGASQPPKSLAFIDGDWREKTREAAQAYIYRTVPNPDKSQPAACFLTDLADQNEAFRKNLFADAARLNGSMAKCGKGYETPEKCWDKN